MLVNFTMYYVALCRRKVARKSLSSRNVPKFAVEKDEIVETKMIMYTMFVILVCFCAEGYFKVADEFKALCETLALPGSIYKLDPNDLNMFFDEALLRIGNTLFGSRDMNEHLNIAKDRCGHSKNNDDLACAFIDFATISNLIADDALKAQETFNSRLQSYPYYYDLYIGAWLVHHLIVKLECEPALKHLYQFLNRLRSLKSFDEYFEIKLLFDNINSKGLQQEIDRLCRDPSTDNICMIRRWINIAYKIDKFLSYVKRDQWENSASKLLKNTMQLYFYAEQVKFLKWHLSWVKNDFVYQSSSEVKIWMNETTEYIFDFLQKNVIESLLSVLELLPYTVHLPCDDNAEFRSMTKTMCTYMSILDSLGWYLAEQNTKGKIKFLSTTIDYEIFLTQKRFERILDIGETTQHNLLLVADKLKSAMRNNFGELRKYIQTLAEFDRKKAQIDVDGITNDLEKYKNASKQSSERLNSLMTKIVQAAFSATIGDQLEAVIAQGLAIADLCNPLSTIFGGGSVRDSFEAAQQVSQAMSGITKTAELKDAFDRLVSESRTFVYKLSENEIYLNSVANLIKSLKSVSSSSSSSPSSSSLLELKGQINAFFDLYENYDPAVTKDNLRAITAFWENLINEACDIINSTSGIASCVAKRILAAQRVCPDATVEVEILITIYEEIYDFQFQLMDSLSDCMRAFTSFQAANAISSDFDGAKHNINNDPDILEKLNMLSAFSMISYKMSVISAIYSYCNVLEYREGRRPSECIGPKTSITSLLSRTKLTCKPYLEFLSIPTKPSKPGDKAFISLIDLNAGKTVAFKIPDRQWLIDHHWIQSFERNDAIFVQRFEIYLPVVSSVNKKVHVVVEATVENKLAPPDGTEYVISPRIRLEFTYSEGNSGGSCRQVKIPNPYSDRCRDMPSICPVTEFPKDSSQAKIYPSIYAHWNIKIHGYEKANLTVPSTNIPLKVGLHLCKFPSERKMKNYNSGFSKSLYAVEQPRDQKAYNSVSFRSNGTCCGSNQYYDESISKCIACPLGTVDKYEGLFCASTFRFVPAPTSDIPSSLAQAQKICTEVRATIASVKTFEKEVAHGYDECRCGWLSEGTMKSPNPNDSCKKNGGLSTVICSSCNTWGVYCNNIF